MLHERYRRFPTPQFSPMCYPSPKFQPMCHESPQLAPMCHRSNQNMTSTSGPKVAGSMGQVFPPAHHPPNSFVSVIRGDNMPIEQTAEWVRKLGRYHAWKEAYTYANNFKANNIGGYLLKKLTKETLKKELGIINYGQLVRELQLPSPMSESTTGTARDEDIACSFQRSPSMRSMMGYSPNLPSTNLELDEHKNEVTKWSESPEMCTTAVDCIRTDIHANSISRSKRASPTNPLVYKTLTKVGLRSRKSYLAKDIGYLPKGAVVLINQIKGRSGRVVFSAEDGSFETAGWVSLFTQDKRHFLKKCNPKTKDVGFAVSSSTYKTVEYDFKMRQSKVKILK